MSTGITFLEKLSAKIRLMHQISRAIHEAREDGVSEPGKTVVQAIKAKTKLNIFKAKKA